jgi:hypothetical protein
VLVEVLVVGTTAEVTLARRAVVRDVSRDERLSAEHPNVRRSRSPATTAQVRDIAVNVSRNESSLTVPKC